MNNIPPKTIERLSKYRTILKSLALNTKSEYIFSHDLAEIANVSPPQVRRDIMSIKHSGNSRKGYHVKTLIENIGTILDAKNYQHVAVIGAGNLGSAIIKYFKDHSSAFKIIAAFDIDEEKNKNCNIPCYNISDFDEIIKKENISIVAITTPASSAETVIKLIKNDKIKGIINFMPFPIKTPPGIFIENIDLSVIFEKASYFVENLKKET